MQDGFFGENIIEIDLAAADDGDAIRKVGAILRRGGYVNDAYIEAVIEREKNFPTGLQLMNAALAIPHATPEGNVLKNGVAVAKLAAPVKFHSMEDPDESVDAEFVFLLALKDSGQHLEILREMFTGFQNEKVVAALQASKTKGDVLKIMEENFAKKK